MLDIHDGYSSLFLALALCVCLQTLFLEFRALFREARQSPRKASVDQFPAITLSPPHLRLKTSPSFLPPAETWYLALARQEPPRNQFAKAKVLCEAARSQPLHKSMPCVATSEAPPSVYRPLATKKKTRLNCGITVADVQLNKLKVSLQTPGSRAGRIRQDLLRSSVW